MKLHQSVVEKLIRLVDLHGGRPNDTRLRAEFAALSISTYTQKENEKKETFLVLTEEVVKAKRQAKKAQAKV